MGEDKGIITEEFLIEHDIKNIKTFSKPNITGISLIVEFNNGDIVEELLPPNVMEVSNVILNILNIRDRNKKIENIIKK